MTDSPARPKTAHVPGTNTTTGPYPDVRLKGHRHASSAILATLFLCLFYGCGSIPLYTHINRERDVLAQSVPRASIVDWGSAYEQSNNRFVGIAMSGGGSRAANFSAAVLQELERHGFLRYVSAISSVSGSSLTAAYYGLFHEKEDVW